MMGAPIFVVFQNPVGIGREGAVGEIHRLDPLAELFVGQEQQAFAAARFRPPALHHAVPAGLSLILCQ